jgi:hypothetical protein
VPDGDDGGASSGGESVPDGDEGAAASGSSGGESVPDDDDGAAASASSGGESVPVDDKGAAASTALGDRATRVAPGMPSYAGFIAGLGAALAGGLVVFAVVGSVVCARRACSRRDGAAGGYERTGTDADHATDELPKAVEVGTSDEV